MNQLFTYIFALLLLSLGSCSPVPEELQRAEQLMESAPDSSLHILQRITVDNRIPNSHKALYGLLLFQARDMNYLTLTPDSLINFSVAYYKQQGEKSRLAAAYLYKARMYKYAFQYEDATRLLLNARENADTTRDFALLGRIYSDLGAICFIQQDYSKAREEYKQEYKYFSRANFKTHALEALLDIGRTYFALHKYDSAALYYKQALAQATDSLSIGSCMQEIAQNYYDQQQYDSALYYLRPLIHYPYIDNNRSIRYCLLADLYFDLRQLDSASLYANATFKFCPNMRTRLACYRILGNIGYLRKKTDELSQYTKLYLACNDSIKKIESQTKVTVLESIHQNDKEIKSGIRNSIILTILLFIVLATGLLIFYYLYKQNKKDKQVHTTQIQEAHSKLVEKQNILIEDLKQKLEREKVKQNCLRKKTTLAERDAFIIELYQSTLYLNDWEEFTRLMNHTFNNMVSTLIETCPTIKKNDMIWCCLHLLDVSPTERMIVLQVSPDSLYKIKQRLAIKLQLNGAKMLDEYLKQFKDTTIS